MAPEYPEVSVVAYVVDNCVHAIGEQSKAIRRDRGRATVGDILSDDGLDADGLDRDAAGRPRWTRTARALRADPRSAPDIAGKGLANPLAHYPFDGHDVPLHLHKADVASRIEKAVRTALASGLRTGDIAPKGAKPATTAEMGSAVVRSL